MNIREVAKKCGVSVATVSRVLNHPESVAAATRERIETVMKESGYTPNWFARGLNLNKTNTIGLMIPHILNAADMEIAEGVEDVAHKKEYTTLLCNAENDVEKERVYIENLVKRKVDGIVLISSLLENEDVHGIIAQGIPVVLIGENKDIHGAPIVSINCQEAAYKAVSHLIENGSTEIAAVYGITPELENKSKIAGYKQALEDNGLTQRKHYILGVDNNSEGGYIAAKKLMELKKPPKAIFASSDIIAFGVMDALKENDIRIPEDVSVVGFDDIIMAHFVDPKLTTIEKPLHKMGVMGARLLFDIMDASEEERKELTREIILESKLKIRKSCGHKERIGEMF